MSETGHFSRLSKQLHRLLKEDFQLDFDIITVEGKVSLHAVVFSIFSASFRQNLTERKKSEIQAAGFKQKEVFEFIKFLYIGGENIPSNATEIIKALNLDLLIDENMKQKRTSKEKFAKIKSAELKYATEIIKALNLDLLIDENMKQKRTSKEKFAKIKSAELKCLRDLTFELTIPKFLDPGFFEFDLLLRTGKDIHKCHKVIVCANSTYFELMLASGMKESQEEMIHLQGIETDIFKQIVNYMYVGKIQITTENGQDLLSNAVYFQIQSLQTICEEFLLKKIDTDNCIEMWSLANLHNCKILSSGSWLYILDNFCFINKLKLFDNLNFQTLCNLLQNSDLNVRNESDVVKFVLDWFKRNETFSENQLTSLFECCRFHLLNEKETEDILEKTKCIKCRFKICDFLKDEITNQQKAGKNVLQRKEKSFLVIKRSSYTTGIEVACYSLTNKTWYSLKTNTRCEGGTGFVCCALKDSILVTGGTATPKYVTKYLVNEDKWVDLPDMNEERSSHAIGLVNEHVYVLGGSNVSEGAFNIVSSIEQFSFSQSQWTKVGNMEIPTYDSAFAVVKSKIYIFGGSMGVLSGVYIKDIQCFDTVTNTCSKIYHNLPTTLSLADACVDNSDIYITCPNGSVIHFNENKAPSIINKTNGSHLMGYSTLYCDNSVYIMGGYSMVGETDGIQKYDLIRDKQVKVDTKLPFKKQTNQLYAAVMHISRKFLINVYSSPGEKNATKSRGYLSPR